MQPGDVVGPMLSYLYVKWLAVHTHGVCSQANELVAQFES